MSIFTRYTWLGDNTIEVVVGVKDGGTSIDVNVLPTAGTELAATAALPLAPVLSEAVVAASLLEPSSAPDPVEDGVAATLAAAPSKKRRTLWGIIRAGWFVVFTASGEALTYALNQLTTLNLPPGTATAIGAVGYGVKRAIWPTTQL